jgi:HEAT repeat protein
MPSNINPFSIFTSISQAIRRIGGSGPDLGNVQAQNNNQDTDMFVPNAGNSPGNAAQNTSNAYRNRVSELIRTLRRTDNDTGERVLAARELGNLGPPEATAPLINAFQNDASIDVRIEAGRALTFRAPNQGGLAPPSALSIFTNALRDPDSEIRNIAATAIGQIAESQGGLSADAITSIINILQDPNANSNTRNSVASLLGKIGQNSPQAVTALINALRDTSSGVRSAAATSLGEIGQDSPQAVTALINALQDDDINVRTAAARSLGQARQNSDEAARALVNQLGNNNQAFISNVIDSLVRIGSTTELTTALQNPNASVRRNAAIALGQIEDSSSVPVLINALRDTDAGVRNAAATALGLTGEGSPQAVDALITAFQNDTDPLGLSMLLLMLFKAMMNRTEVLLHLH